jgi:hypothetical protein
MNAYIGVVNRAPRGTSGLLDGVVIAALSARTAIGVLGSGLVLLSLLASMVR